MEAPSFASLSTCRHGIYLYYYLGGISQQTAMQFGGLLELQKIISKMSVHACCVLVLPEFGVQWMEVSNAIRDSKLPVTSASIAQVLTQHVYAVMSADETDEILKRLKLKLVMTQSRTWHTLGLLEPTEEYSDTHPRRIRSRVMKAVSQMKTSGNMRPEVNVADIENLIYLSIQMVSDTRQGVTLYVAIPLGEPVIFVSSFSAVKLLNAVVQGLGYKNYENVALFGPDISSLLRIINKNHTDIPEHLAGITEYDPKPIVTAKGIDYTNISYDKEYVENILGPNPPLLTDLKITSDKPFHDINIANISIKLELKLKSANIAMSIVNWVAMQIIGPDSEFINFFQAIKSNVLVNSE